MLEKKLEKSIFYLLPQNSGFARFMRNLSLQKDVCELGLEPIESVHGLLIINCNKSPQLARRVPSRCRI